MLEKAHFELLKNYLSNGVLPGVEAHKKMAPLPDRLLEQPSPETRHAAVIILLYPHLNDWCIPLIHRNSKNPNDPHKGQISLPGGRMEEQDETLLHTALRETKEEIGIDLNTSHVLGGLSPLYIPVSKNKVFPYVACIDFIPDFIRQENEVESIWSCPLGQLLNPQNKEFRNLKTSYAEEIRVPGLSIEDKWIWGATAMILEEFHETYLASMKEII